MISNALFQSTLLLAIFHVITSASVIPLTVDRRSDRRKDCKGVCKGQWAQWADWGECLDSQCHRNMGKRTRQTNCYVMNTITPSMGDSDVFWALECQEVEEKDCVLETTCDGEWSAWGSWKDCYIENNETGCMSSRRRYCQDLKFQRVPGTRCLGGADNDTMMKFCDPMDCRSHPLIMEDSVQPRKTYESEKKNSGFSHSMSLIIGVAVGSLLLGALFVFLLLNIARKSATSTNESSNTRWYQWKRIGSTNTNSIGYSAGYLPGSDVQSPRPDFQQMQSPTTVSTNTTSSGSSAASQQQFFGRSEVRSPVQTEGAVSIATISSEANSKKDAEKPRRSRLLQENIYWEIADNSAREEGSSSAESSRTGNVQSDGSTSDRELVNNVLYSGVL